MSEQTASTKVPSTFRVMLRADVAETARAWWYLLFVAGFAALMALFFGFGLSESSILGFTGLNRMLLTYIQATLLLLPVFVLVTVARTLVTDREAGVWEYFLSWPVSLGGFYWAKAAARVCVVLLPLLVALAGAILFGMSRGEPIPWAAVAGNALLLGALVLCFTGIAMLVTVLASSQEIAIAIAFALWTLLEAGVDSLLLGLLVKLRLPAELVMGLALFNPIQSFRLGALVLFDPELTSLGPVSYTLFEWAGRGGLIAWAAVWPSIVGIVCLALGARFFRKGDIVS